MGNIPLFYFSASGNTKYCSELVQRGMLDHEMKVNLVRIKSVQDLPFRRHAHVRVMGQHLRRHVPGDLPDDAVVGLPFAKPRDRARNVPGGRRTPRGSASEAA